MLETLGSTTQARPMPSRRPSPRARGLLGAQLVVAGQLERAVEAGLVVARVVDGAGRGAVGHLAGQHEVAARELRRVDPEPPGGDVHRALERAVELRPAEAAVEARGRAIAHHDAAAHGEILHVVGAGQAAVHAVERGRLGRAHVGADLVDQVEPQAEQAPVRVERRLDLARALGRHRGRRAGARCGPPSSARGRRGSATRSPSARRRAAPRPSCRTSRRSRTA